MGGRSAESSIHWGKALAWGCFLGSSWTWVIGMFLPFYLLADFGVLGWVVFALVNVPGAMLVGWVWRRAGDSERFVQQNEGAMRLFSIAAVLFQIGFLGWFLEAMSLNIAGDYAFGAVGVALLMVIAMLLGALGSRGWLALAVLALLASLGAIIAASSTSWGMGVADPRLIIPRHDAIALALASPALAIGFLLCPHLDLTLHRARQEAPGATGTAAFVIGFGVLFLAMIAFTLFYVAGGLAGSWSYYVIAHIAVQATFTSGAHFRELFERGIVFTRETKDAIDEGTHRRRVAITASLSALAIIVAILVGIALNERWIPLGEFEVAVRDGDGSTTTRRFTLAAKTIYQSYLALFALVFPAWLWIGVLMGRGLGARARIGLWLLALAIAGPLFALGYLGERFALIPLAVGVVLVVGEAARRLGSRRPSTT